MDKIGLVTVTYNSAVVIRSFLDCVCKQTYSNWILYDIDNASVDDTLLILGNENDSRIRVVENTENLKFL